MTEKKDVLYKDVCFKTINELIDNMKHENARQIDKWGIQEHTLFEWLAYTTEEIGELSKAISEYVYRKGTLIDIFDEAIQTATLSLKIAEMIINNID